MKNKLINLNLILVLVVTLFSCSEDYLDVNNDPNNVTAESVTPNVLLPVAQFRSAESMLNTTGGGRTLNTLGNFMAGSWSQSDGFAYYDTEFQYLLTPANYGLIWQIQYAFALKNYRQVQLASSSSNYAFYKAIAQIMETYHFQMLVDAYGDVPYSEALQRGVNTTPAFDNQEEIYDNLIVTLTSAIALIEDGLANGALNPEGNDTMLNGDMTEWKRLANTLKLKILVRQSGLSSKLTYLQNEYNAIMAQGDGFITNNVYINPGYFADANKQNPFWNSYGEDSSGTETANFRATTASEYMITKLSDSNDSRIDRLFETPDTGHLGVPQGLFPMPADTYLPAQVSNIGPGLLISAEQGAPVFTVAEAKLLNSEAILSTIASSGDAKAEYEAGVIASFTYLGLTAGDANAYMAQGLPNVSWDDSTNKLEAIINQKYVALTGTNGFETWVELSRTGFPNDIPTSLQATTLRPVRISYPNSEIASNGANVPSQPNVYTQKIFWAN